MVTLSGNVKHHSGHRDRQVRPATDQQKEIAAQLVANISNFLDKYFGEALDTRAWVRKLLTDPDDDNGYGVDLDSADLIMKRYEEGGGTYDVGTPSEIAELIYNNDKYWG